MTYEEKLQKIVSKLKEERQLTRKNHTTKVTFDDKSFTKVRLKDIGRILLILQSDEKALKIVDSYAINPPPDKIGKPLQEEDCEEIVQIIVELNEDFDNWYIKYLLKQKALVSNLNWINLIKILDVCMDIDQQLQIERGCVVLISSFPYPYVGRFPDLFPFDSIGTRKVYQQHRWEGVQYLQKEGVALKIKLITNDSLGYGSIEISLNIDLFNDFYQKIKDEYAKRNNTSENTNEQTIKPTIVQYNQSWPNDFIWKGELLRVTMRKSEKSIGINKRSLIVRWQNSKLPMKNII